jgi:hypothetical protein
MVVGDEFWEIREDVSLGIWDERYGIRDMGIGS